MTVTLSAVWLVIVGFFGQALSYPVTNNNGCIQTLVCTFEHKNTCAFLESENWKLERSSTGFYQRYEYTDGSVTDLDTPPVCNGVLDIQLSCLIISNPSLPAELQVLTQCDSEDSPQHPYVLSASKDLPRSWQNVSFTREPCPTGQRLNVVFRAMFALPGSVILLDNVRLHSTSSQSVRTTRKPDSHTTQGIMVPQSTVAGCSHSLNCRFDRNDTCGFGDSDNWKLAVNNNSDSFQEYSYTDGSVTDLVSPALCNGLLDVQLFCAINFDPSFGPPVELHVLTQCNSGDRAQDSHVLSTTKDQSGSWKNASFTLPPCSTGDTLRVVFRAKYALPGSLIRLDNVHIRSRTQSTSTSSTKSTAGQPQTEQDTSTRHDVNTTSKRRHETTTESVASVTSESNDVTSSTIKPLSSSSLASSSFVTSSSDAAVVTVTSSPVVKTISTVTSPASIMTSFPVKTTSSPPIVSTITSTTGFVSKTSSVIKINSSPTVSTVSSPTNTVMKTSFATTEPRPIVKSSTETTPKSTDKPSSTHKSNDNNSTPSTIQSSSHGLITTVKTSQNVTSSFVTTTPRSTNTTSAIHTSKATGKLTTMLRTLPHPAPTFTSQASSSLSTKEAMKISDYSVKTSASTNVNTSPHFGNNKTREGQTTMLSTLNPSTSTHSPVISRVITAKRSTAPVSSVSKSASFPMSSSKQSVGSNLSTGNPGTNTETNAAQPDKSSGRKHINMIVGITVGAVGLVVLLVVVVFIYRKYKTGEENEEKFDLIQMKNHSSDT